MPMYKFGYASVVKSSVSVDDWTNRVYKDACKDGQCRLKTAKSVIAQFSPEKYVLSHCSIIASVETDLANPKDAKTDYYIKPEFSSYVNNNGDAWTKGVILNSYKSFIGAENYCFPAGTRVLMSDGVYKDIDLIREGDLVINRNGEISKVVKTFNREVTGLIEINSTNILSRTLFVTKEHPFWVFSARKTCPKTGRPNFFNKEKDFYHLDTWTGFSVGVHRANGEAYSCGVSPNWVEAKNINPDRDFLTHPISSVEIENQEINENRAELIGWYLAEGNLSNLNKFSDDESGVVFSLGNDESDVAERLSNLLTIEFGQHFRSDCKPRIYETESGSYNLCLCNAEVAKFFKKWCGKLAWSKKLAKEALWLPKKLQAIILKHCINGDGCGEVESRGYSLEMKTKSLIQQMLFISWRLEMSPVYKETGVLPRYSECEIIDGFERYYDPVTNKKSRPGYLLRFSVRDSKKLNEFLGLQDLRVLNRVSKKITQILDENNNRCILSKVDSIKLSDISCKVYNIEVEGDNSYIIEGVIVHNCEHVQIQELSKGKIIDAVPREIIIGKDKSGKDLSTVYIDILVATERKHEDLVRKIESKEISSLSMGCLIKYSICSKCGNKATDETDACQHIRFQKNNMFFDENGVQRKIAELCGHKDDPESVKFIEASWVRQPAFTGAVLRSFVTPSAEIMAKFDEASKRKPYKKQIGDYLKAASELIAQDDKKEEDPPPPPEEEESPKEEEPAPTDAPAEEAGPVDPTLAPPEEESDIKVWKKDLKKQVLKQIQDDVLKDLSDEGPEGPRDLETLDETLIKPATAKQKKNETFTKPASLTLGKLWGAQKSWDRFILQKVGNIDKKNLDRLRYGVHIAMTNNDLTVLKDYGYTKRDMLAVLSFIDGCMKNSLPIKVKKTIASIGGSEGKSSIDILKVVVSSLGRKITKDEAKKILSWVRLMDFYG